MTRKFAFEPFIGFEELIKRMNANDPFTSSDSYPPYNIVDHDNDRIVIEIAVAGFTKAALKVQKDGNVLEVIGKRASDKDVKYFHRGIANRAFHRKFTLAEGVEVDHVKLVHGMLLIGLKYQKQDQSPEEFQIEVTDNGQTLKDAAEFLQE